MIPPVNKSAGDCVYGPGLAVEEPMKASKPLVPIVALALVAVAVLISGGAGAQEPTAPRTIVETATNAIKQIVLQARTDEELQQKTSKILEELIDFETFGKLCLLRVWNTLTPQQQATYLAEFRQLLQRTYLKRFALGQAFKVEFRGETRVVATGERAEVPTTITSGKTVADVDYRFRLSSTWKVYDIVVDDVSIMLNYRKAFTKVFKQDGFDTLLEKMRKKRTVDEAIDGEE
jgi:phospholipid transport system substrate-binding protein